MSEFSLIDDCLKKDSKAQQKLYEQYASALLGICMRYAKDRQQAEDFLQEAFIRIFMNLKNFERKSSLRTWMERIVINTAITHYKKEMKHSKHDNISQMDETKSLQEDTFEPSFSQEELLQVIRELPKGFQLVFNLYAIEGYKHREIADLLDIDVNTSKSQYSRAKKLIREKLFTLSQIKESSTRN